MKNRGLHRGGVSPGTSMPPSPMDEGVNLALPVRSAWAPSSCPRNFMLSALPTNERRVVEHKAGRHGEPTPAPFERHRDVHAPRQHIREVVERECGLVGKDTLSLRPFS
jgi:hypothetical protein